MAGREGLSHAAACQRWRRGPAQPSGTAVREAETQTNPSALHGLTGTGNEIDSWGESVCCELIISVQFYIKCPMFRLIKHMEQLMMSVCCWCVKEKHI